MKKICVLSFSSINDSRAQRTIRSMSKITRVDFFYLGNNKNKINYSKRFNDNVNLFPLCYKKTFLSKVLYHSFAYLESSFFVEQVIKTGKKYDLIYAHDFMTSYPACQLAKRFNAKILYDVHDLYLETVNQFFPSKTISLKYVIFELLMYFIKTVGKRWEKKFTKKTDLVITTNPNYLNYLSAQYPISNCVVVPNYPEYRDVKYTKKIYEIFDLNEDINIVLYHGALNPGRNLELIVKSAEYYNNKNILVIIGNGPLEAKLKQIVDQKKLTQKVKFLDLINYHELFSYISSAILGLMLIEHINLSKKFALANKVTEYMASGVPVLASDSPENRRIINEADCGFIKNFSSAKELGNFINRITINKEELIQMGLRGKKAFKEKFNWNLYEPIFMNEFKNLLQD